MFCAEEKGDTWNINVNNNNLGCLENGNQYEHVLHFTPDPCWKYQPVRVAGYE